MSSFVSAPNAGGELHGVKYQAARVERYGKQNQYRLDIPAYVSFYLGRALVELTVSDARDLLEALPNVLAQHDYAEYVTDQPKAVA